MRASGLLGLLMTILSSTYDLAIKLPWGGGQIAFQVRRSRGLALYGNLEYFAYM